MYPISIIEKRERKNIFPGVVFNGHDVIFLSGPRKPGKFNFLRTATFINSALVIFIICAVILLYLLPFVNLNTRDKEVYLYLATITTSVPGQPSLLVTLQNLGVTISVSNFDSNISIVSLINVQDTRELLEILEPFKGIIAIQNSINGFQIKVVRGIL